jgi:hypothetical protein
MYYNDNGNDKSINSSSIYAPTSESRHTGQRATLEYNNGFNRLVARVDGSRSLPATSHEASLKRGGRAYMYPP